MQGSTSNCRESSDVPVNGQRLYTRRTILSENINRTRLSREHEKRSKAQLSNGSYDDDDDDEDDEDDAEFFNNIKKKIFKEDAPQHREMYTSKRKTSRLDENCWNVMRNFKENLKNQQDGRMISSPKRAFRKKEQKPDYPFNLFESGNEDALSGLERGPLDCEINSTLRNIAQNEESSQRTSTQAAAFSFSDDVVTVSPAVLSSQDERLEKQIEEEVYYISANRLMDLCEKVDVQSPTTSFPDYPSPVASSIFSPYRQFDSQPE